MGLRGEVDVLVVSDYPRRFEPGSVVLAGDRSLTVRSVRHQGERNIVSFAEVADRSGAEALRGLELVVPIAHARALDQDEYWDHDLVGCAVVTSDGEEIGVVTDVLHQPANEVLVVAGKPKEVLVPLIASIVRGVEPGKRITIDAPPGLLDEG